MRRSIVICLIFRYGKIKLDEQHMQPRHDFLAIVSDTSDKLYVLPTATAPPSTISERYPTTARPSLRSSGTAGWTPHQIFRYT